MVGEIPFGGETDACRTCKELGILRKSVLTDSRLGRTCIALAGRSKDCAEATPLAGGRVVDVVHLLIPIIELLQLFPAYVLLNLHLIEFFHILVELQLFDEHILHPQILRERGLLTIPHD